MVKLYSADDVAVSEENSDDTRWVKYEEYLLLKEIALKAVDCMVVSEAQLKEVLEMAEASLKRADQVLQEAK